MLGFRDSSIRNKLTTIIMLTSAVVLLLASLAFVGHELSAFRRSMENDLLTMADLVNINSSAGLLFGDSRTVQENINALKAKSNIQSAHIFTRNGLLFASYFRNQQIPKGFNKDLSLGSFYFAQRSSEQTGLTIRDNLFWEDDRVEVFKQIRFQKNILGTVYIRADLSELHNRLRWAAVITATVMLLSMLLAFVLASRLQGLVTHPIFHLLRIMQKVSQEKNYNYRALKTSNDELGRLIDGFNHMLMQIYTNNQELQDYRDHLEEKVERRTIELAEARDEALAASKAKSIFLANMSHEIRTPMNAVLGYTQILQRDTELSHGQRESLQIIERSGSHLLGLINDILDISKIEAGAAELRQEDFCLMSLLEDINGMFQLRCEQKNLHWQINCTLEQPHPIYADQGKLRQMLINLLSNAVKFTDSGSITLTVEQLFKATERDPYYCFSVCDTGPGIPQAAQQHIFEAFQQEQAGLDKGGTGLGLAITKHQVELMHGHIAVQSELGKGACFYFELPLQAGDFNTLMALSAQQQPLSKMRLCSGQSAVALVVDDIEDNRAVLVRMLQDIGIEVGIANSGKAALAHMRQCKPTVVFAHIRMPDMDGVQLMQAILSEWQTQAPVCIAISASPLLHHNQQVLDAGYADFISKPFYFEDVYEALQTHLNVEFERLDIAEKAPETVVVNGNFSQIKLPKDLYARLVDAAEFNELTELEQLISELQAAKAKDWQALAQACQERLDNYDIEGITELLEGLTNARVA